MEFVESADVAKVFKNYPEDLRQQLNNLRSPIIETAQETEGVVKLEECLKWGEPSYLTKHGSTVRMNVSSSTPGQYALYFNCKSKLIDTCKELYNDKLKFEGNRAIVFNKSDKLPKDELKHCIKLALTYHKVKHLPLLGS